MGNGFYCLGNDGKEDRRSSFVEQYVKTVFPFGFGPFSVTNILEGMEFACDLTVFLEKIQKRTENEGVWPRNQRKRLKCLVVSWLGRFDPLLWLSSGTKQRLPRLFSSRSNKSLETRKGTGGSEPRVEGKGKEESSFGVKRKKIQKLMEASHFRDSQRNPKRKFGISWFFAVEQQGLGAQGAITFKEQSAIPRASSRWHQKLKITDDLIKQW